MIYASAISDGVHNLMTMESAPAEVRAERIIAKLRGVDVGDRWATLADNYAGLSPGQYAFDDVHAMLAMVGAGRDAEAEAILAILQTVAEGTGENARITREVGLPIAEAIQAFGQGRHPGAIERLRAVRNHAARFGGSHAQRDIIDLTLIAAAGRAGETALERALLAERAAALPLV